MLSEPIDLLGRLHRLMDGVPDEASITLPAHLLRQWLEDAGVTPQEAAEASAALPHAGFTVAQVAEHLELDPSTIRGHIAAGRFGEVRKARGRWRLTPANVATFVDGPAAEPTPATRRGPELSGNGDLSAWRRERSG